MTHFLDWATRLLARREGASNDPTLNRAQFNALTKQMPVLYCVLIANALSVGYTHAAIAPAALSIYFPLVLSLVCLARLIVWRRSQAAQLDDAQIARRLQSMALLTAALSSAITSWCMLLYPHGGPYEQSQVAFFMSVTVLGCLICLTHLTSASALLFVTGVIPFSVFLASSGNAVVTSIAFNLVFVAGAMAFVACRHHRDFVDLAQARQGLIARQAETRRLSDDNFRLANLDALTGLPNRRRFLADLEAMLAEAASQQRKIAVGLIDLDGFKPVNDIYGHACGDQLLLMVAERLRPMCGPRDILARLGGDEFGLVMTKPGDDADVRELGRILTKALQEPFDMPQIRVQISGSIGFAVFPRAAGTAEQLFERADYALHHAKDGKRGVVVFSAKHERKIREAGLVARHLRSADLEAEMSVVFQPITDTRTGKTIGFEALARWTSPKLGEIPPDTFIPLAERYNLVNKLTRVLLRKTLRAAAGWPGQLRVSFNLSTFDIASPGAMARIVGILKSEKFPIHRLDFEITETAVLVDFEQARRSLEMLKALNARVSLDDFGCGYSSLAYVQKLPLDRIKIDRGFIADIEGNKASRNIVKTIVDLCRNLDLACVAEGVETHDQLRVAQSLGCHTVQGYFFAQPMANDRVGPYLLRETQRLTAAGLVVGERMSA